MPRRPIQHKLGDLGVAQVKLLCVQSGWACDETHSDYGEDLIAQTELNGIVDPRKIMVQVKTTKKTPRFKDGILNQRVSRDHVTKWILDPNYFVFVLWCEEQNLGYWAIPSKQFSTWQLDETENKSVSLKLNEEKVLNETSLKQFEWQARINNYNRYLLEIDSNLRSIDPEDFDSLGDFTTARHGTRREVLSVCGAFLEAIGLVHRCKGGLTIDGHGIVYTMARFKALRDEHEEKPASLGFNLEESAFALILARLMFITEGVGVPNVLLEKSARLLKVLIKSYEEEVGQEIGIHLF